MLTTHVRGCNSLRRVPSFSRSSALSSRATVIEGPAALNVRRYVVSRQLRPARRLGLTESRIGHLLHERSLATAVDDYKFGASPYNHNANADIPLFQSPPRSHDARLWGGLSPLSVPAPDPDDARNIVSRHAAGIPGGADDMLAIFDACIRVGKLERAALVLKRFKHCGGLTGEERIILNNRYLRASLDMMRTDPDMGQIEKLHEWYELQIRNQSLPHTAETIACMLKASLLSERGSRLERLVKRYMGMAPGEAGLKVLNMADVLSDQDLAVITKICPTYNFTAEVEEDVTDGLKAESDAELSSVELNEDMVSMDAPVPELLPTPQRGTSLTTLKQGMHLLLELQNIDVSKLSDSDRHELQLRLERDVIDSAIEKWRHDNANMQKIGINPALSGSTKEGSLSQQMASWLPAMESSIREELIRVEEAEVKEERSEQDLERCLYGPIISQSDPARLAAVTMLVVMNQGAASDSAKGINMHRLVSNIARLVQEDILDQQRAKATKERRRKVEFIAPTNEDEQATKAGRKSKKVVETNVVKTDEVKAGRPPIHKVYLSDTQKTQSALKETISNEWSPSIQARVGSILLKMLVDVARIKVTREHPVTKELVSQYQPAFTHKTQPRRGKKVGIIALNPYLEEQLAREPPGDYLAKHLPMIVEPKPWKLFDKGGFLNSKVSAVRLKSEDHEQRLYAKESIRRGDMNQIFKGLDVLGKTAWRINRNVLDVMVEAWNTGESFLDFPALKPNFTLPPEPDASADPRAHSQWQREVTRIENERSAMHSQRCHMNLQLEIARAFRNQTIYFPHNLDYRGRAYPMPTYLNHMGADHTRGILTFAQGKELGAVGLRWLKIHLANLYGLDKAKFDDREAFATDNMDNIIDSATNPLNGNRWWMQAEDPWQCLGACFELKAAHELPDPTKYVSSFPVHQDGTCNGLQHYAALGGDTHGAQQVNLEPADKPADVYTAVADMVKEVIRKDAILNDGSSDNRLALLLDGKITRKVVKQTVMTNVYGVTFEGAKKQVLKQLDALYPGLGKEDGVHGLVLATYVSKHIFASLASMFRGAHDIQYWLGEVGGRICRALTESQIQQVAAGYDDGDAAKPKRRGKTKAKVKTITSKAHVSKFNAGFKDLMNQFCSTIVWTTPLRMTIVQPYRKPSLTSIRTCMQTMIYQSAKQTSPVNRRKQLQGFPPNYIHSLDASHMLLSALKCSELGLDFAAVHDSFWTHASDVDQMNRVLRDAFIRIHEEDVVGRLAAEFKARHSGSIYLEMIDGDSAVAKKIKDLRLNSKLSPVEELLLEHKRQGLLRSGNPWDIDAAKQIITPASVYEDMSALEQQAVVEKTDEVTALGDMQGSSTSTQEAEQFTEQTDEMDGSEVMAAEDSLDDYNDDVMGAGAIPEEPSEDATSSVLGEPTRPREDDLSFEKHALGERRKTHKSASGKKAKTVAIPVWLPLTLPPVPQKGDFDVSRLRDSKYFFS